MQKRITSDQRGHRVFLGALLILLLLGLIAPRAARAAFSNCRSITYWRSGLASLACLNEPAAASEHHPRTAYWFAVQANVRADWSAVETLAYPLVKEDDFLAMQLTARSFEARADYASALEIWLTLGSNDALFKFAETAERAGEPEMAIQAYQAVWNTQPRITTERIAKLLAAGGDRPAAIALYRASLDRINRFDDRLPSWNRSLARLLMEEERWFEATQAWERVVQHTAQFYYGPSELDVLHDEIATAYFMDNQHEQARASIESAIESEPSTEVYAMAGLIFESLGDHSVALSHYEQALKLDTLNEIAILGIERLNMETDTP
jgi:tetratricopeptide (TPR) repeat protein